MKRGKRDQRDELIELDDWLDTIWAAYWYQRKVIGIIHSIGFGIAAGVVLHLIYRKR